MRRKLVLPLALAVVAPAVLFVPSSSAVPLMTRVNAGGEAFTDGNGNSWAASSGFVGGRKGTTTPQVAGPLGKLYSTDWVLASGYNQKVSNGSYQVRLHAVEGYHTAVGKRVFSVTAEGKPALSNVDLFARAGKDVGQILQFPVTVTDGELNLGFSASKDGMTVSGIELVPQGVTVRVNAGGSAVTDGNGNAWEVSSGFADGRLGTVPVTVSGAYSKVYAEDWVKMTSYKRPVVNGSYKVKLYSVESYFSSKNSRVFSVTAEGKTVLSNVDLFARAGKGVPQVLEFSTTVTDGELTLGFPATKDSATFSGIEIVPVTSSAPGTSEPAPAPGLPQVQQVTTNGFAHPGVSNSAASLTAMRSQILAGAAPQKAAYDKMKSSRFASLSWTPKPVAYVGCGAGTNPNEGCTAETDDAQAAYTHALLWYVTGNKAHADKAKEILNAWSGTLKDHRFDTSLYTNGLLQAAWAGETFTKAAELVRYTNAGWSASDIARFEGMLKTAFLPRVVDGWTWGAANWELSMAEATMNIGVFTSDRAVYDNGVADWRRVVPSAFYLSTDGSRPVPLSGLKMDEAKFQRYWSSPTIFPNGIAAETCRDASHMAMGLGAALSAAETARIQGLDLYGEQGKRLTTTMEYNAKFINDPSAAGWPCAAPLKLGGEMYSLTWATGYNHYARRTGAAMPETAKLLSSISPTRSALHFSWESLTHSSK